MNNVRKVLSYLIYIPLLLGVFLLQTAILSRFPIAGAYPLLLPLTVVGVAMYAGVNVGGMYGLFAGILCDISLNQPVIQFTLLLTAVGLLTGYAAEKVLIRSFPTFLLCSVFVLTASAVAQAFDLVFFYKAELLACARTYVAQTLYSLVFSLPIFFITRKITRMHRS